MTRRSMLALGTRALAAYPVLARTGPLDAFARAQAGQSIPAAVLRRIGITTVCFRDRFTQTREKSAGPIPAGQELTLLTAPRFIADTLGLHNVEIWNAQFADMSIDYCRQIKAAAEAVKSRIINVQVDGPENLSDPDAAKRAASIQTIKLWMDRAAAVGAPTCRANTGGGTPEAWDVNRTADSFRQLAQYGRKIGVKILVENHIGYSADIDKVVAVVKAVNDPYCRTLCDWGNSPSGSIDARDRGPEQALPAARARLGEGARLRRAEPPHQLRCRADHQGDRGRRLQGDLLDRVLRQAAEGHRGRSEGHDRGAVRQHQEHRQLAWRNRR